MAHQIAVERLEVHVKSESRHTVNACPTDTPSGPPPPPQQKQLLAPVEGRPFRGCLGVSRGCLGVFWGCLGVFRGCLGVFRGCLGMVQGC